MAANKSQQKVPSTSKDESKFKNQLMTARWMVERPEDLAQKWLMLTYPAGKRVLVATHEGETHMYTQKGFKILSFRSHLPGGNVNQKNWQTDETILDCVFDEEEGHIYILDLISWKGHNVSESDFFLQAEFRFYWLKCKVADIPELGHKRSSNAFKFSVVPFVAATTDSMKTSIEEVPFKLDGILFYHKDNVYSPGRASDVLWLRPFMVPEAVSVPVPEKFLAERPSSYKDFASYAKAKREEQDKAEAQSEKAKEASQDAAKEKVSKPKDGKKAEQTKAKQQSGDSKKSDQNKTRQGGGDGRSSGKGRGRGSFKQPHLLDYPDWNSNQRGVYSLMQQQQQQLQQHQNLSMGRGRGTNRYLQSQMMARMAGLNLSDPSESLNPPPYPFEDASRGGFGDTDQYNQYWNNQYGSGSGQERQYGSRSGQERQMGSYNDGYHAGYSDNYSQDYYHDYGYQEYGQGDYARFRDMPASNIGASRQTSSGRIIRRAQDQQGRKAQDQQGRKADRGQGPGGSHGYKKGQGSGGQNRGRKQDGSKAGEDSFKEGTPLVRGKRKKENVAYGQNYRTQLMCSQWMTEVPEAFVSDWLMVPCPVGTRRRVVASSGKTIAYSKRGQEVESFKSKFPGGNEYCKKNELDHTVLDCIYSKSTKCFYILDVMSWKGQPLCGTETGFRFYWLHAKLKEDTTVQQESKLNKYVFTALPNYSCDKESLQYFVDNEINYQLDGLLFFKKDSQYVAGSVSHVLWLKPYMLTDALGLQVPEAYVKSKPENYVDFASYMAKFKDQKEFEDQVKDKSSTPEPEDATLSPDEPLSQEDQVENVQTADSGSTEVSTKA